MSETPAPMWRIKLSDQIAEDLSHRIARERLTPGERLPNARALMQRKGRAKGTIREALKSLEVQGLVTTPSGPNGGPEIRPISVKAAQQLRRFLHFQELDFAQVYALRQGLEVALGASVVGRLGAGDFAHPEANIAA
ncbi:FadR/GntR family transcriptional regulator [Methylobacterium sp. J-090]|uniref:FadR/GntR family transcriptional regulator n=1 Tax=Methylobacterium sp. J-090 TaxID=2836666 RepID=UPI001FBA4566|nr:GntR family transcriptional regulator [Methylobacterium sp. J-090]MCJ2082791.1 GntR family transcriptional regulator [Methylobacterium sp. J-090]